MGNSRQLLIVIIYLFLLLCAIPWYWPVTSTGHLFGFPYWVLSSLFFALLTSFFTSYLLLFSEQDKSGQEDGEAE